MKFGYARVSRPDQRLSIQVEKLHAAGCDEIFQETISGAKDHRPQLDALLGKLRKGDTVCVVRLDRLGRRMMKLVALLTLFQSKGVEFIALDNQLDTTTPMGMLLFHMCAAFAEMERELIRERVQAGLAFAREQGRKGGRPRVLTPEKIKTVKALKASNALSVKQICATVKISRSVYYRCLHEAKS